jgi:hypothetical protein
MKRLIRLLKKHPEKQCGASPPACAGPPGPASREARPKTGFLIQILLRALEPWEREVVLGDLTESGISGARALFEISGIVLRRQLQIWTTWRPWLALFGVVGISGSCLSVLMTGLNMSIWEQWAAWQRYGVHYNTGVTSFRDDVILMTCLAAAVFCITTINLSMLGRLSGRASWLTGLLFYCAVFDAVFIWIIGMNGRAAAGDWPWWVLIRGIFPISPQRICNIVVLFLIPAICAARIRLRSMIPATVALVAIAAVVAATRSHDLETYSSGAFRAPFWWMNLAPLLLPLWPILFARRNQV